MTRIRELSHQFRRPQYPVLVDLDERLVAAKSAKSLLQKLSALELPVNTNYPVIDGTGEGLDRIIGEIAELILEAE